MHNLADRLWQKYSLLLACATAFLITLKLALAYAACIPLILLLLASHYRQLPALLKGTGRFSYPFLAFASALLASSLFGINLTRSLSAIPSLLFFPLAVIAIYVVSKQSARPIVLSLIAGQALAALHSVVDSSAGRTLPRMFLGAVTESGQIGLTLVTALGLALFLHLTVEKKDSILHPHSVIGLANVALLSLLAFRPAFASSIAASAAAGASILSILVCSALALRKHGPARLSFLLSTIIIPIITAALIANLKRGPWAGVLFGGSLLFLVYDRKLLIPLLSIALAALILIPPVQKRVLQSSGDFFISGGRSVIWEIGAELATRYPLGIGYRNSPFLQRFAPEIPPELKHFHNNLLNVAVEGGWLSVSIYAWWMLSMISLPFLARRDSVLAVALGCALVSWQVAGLVEFNFGDSEVLLLTYIVIGLMLRFVEDGDRAYLGREIPSSR